MSLFGIGFDQGYFSPPSPELDTSCPLILSDLDESQGVCDQSPYSSSCIDSYENPFPRHENLFITDDQPSPEDHRRTHLPQALGLSDHEETKPSTSKKRGRPVGSGGGKYTYHKINTRQLSLVYMLWLSCQGYLPEERPSEITETEWNGLKEEKRSKKLIRVTYKEGNTLSITGDARLDKIYYRMVMHGRNFDTVAAENPVDLNIIKNLRWKSAIFSHVSLHHEKNTGRITRTFTLPEELVTSPTYQSWGKKKTLKVFTDLIKTSLEQCIGADEMKNIEINGLVPRKRIPISQRFAECFIEAIRNTITNPTGSALADSFIASSSEVESSSESDDAPPPKQICTRVNRRRISPMIPVNLALQAMEISGTLLLEKKSGYTAATEGVPYLFLLWLILNQYFPKNRPADIPRTDWDRLMHQNVFKSILQFTYLNPDRIKIELDTILAVVYFGRTLLKQELPQEPLARETFIQNMLVWWTKNPLFAPMTIERGASTISITLTLPSELSTNIHFNALDSASALSYLESTLRETVRMVLRIKKIEAYRSRGFRFNYHRNYEFFPLRKCFDTHLFILTQHLLQTRAMKDNLCSDPRASASQSSLQINPREHWVTDIQLLGRLVLLEGESESQDNSQEIVDIEK